MLSATLCVVWKLEEFYKDELWSIGSPIIQARHIPTFWHACFTSSRYTSGAWRHKSAPQSLVPRASCQDAHDLRYFGLGEKHMVSFSKTLVMFRYKILGSESDLMPGFSRDMNFGLLGDSRLCDTSLKPWPPIRLVPFTFWFVQLVWKWRQWQFHAH